MDDLKYYVDKTVHKFLGFDEPSIVTSIIDCLNNGLDKNQMTKKLTLFFDENKAAKLSSKIHSMLSDSRLLDPAFKPAKKQKLDPGDINKVLSHIPQQADNQPSALLSDDKIKEMMVNAQKMIEERKKQLQIMQPELKRGDPSKLMLESMEKAKQAAELHAKIQSKFASRPDLLSILNNTGPNAIDQTPTGKPVPLVLDEYGRTLDSSGKAIPIAQPMPTLKANIRARKREEFKVAIQEKPVDEEIGLGKFFDPRIDVSHALANTTKHIRKTLKFHDKGKFEQMAQKLRAKARLEQLQNQISQAVKKTGIISAAKLALMIPKKDMGSKTIPQCEWWDSIILKQENYNNVDNNLLCLESGRITNLIQHPMKMHRQKRRHNTEVTILLNKKERKKLRRQNRREIWLEKQEKIRLGLEPAPEPKMKISNLMRVLGKEAVLDPTKIESHVRAQMAKRQKTHEEANLERKLTPEQRSAKKAKKIKEDTNDEVHVAVFRVKSLSNLAKKFKVETNANQLFMTGFVALFKDVNVIVVEGGPRQVKKFKHLMLERIKWEEERLSSTFTLVTPKNAANATEALQNNKCDLVWEGVVRRRSFGPMTFKFCPSEAYAREAFIKHEVEHYWNSAYSQSLLEQPDTSAPIIVKK